MSWLLLIPLIPYLFILPAIYFYTLRIRRFLVPAGFSPSTFISVVIACRNERENIPALLAGLKCQDYPGHLFEVIIADDNSSDDTNVLSESLAGKLNLRVVRSAGKGKKAALRTAILASEGAIILTTDADCIVPEGWISTVAAFFSHAAPDMVVLPVKLTRIPGFFGRFQELEFLSLQAVTAGTVVAGRATMCNGANLAFTRKAWLENEKNIRYDIATGDDVFLLHSIKKNKGRILWLESPDALVTTNASSGLGSWVRQRKRWASKATEYRDAFSIFLGIVTFVTILWELILLVSSFAGYAFFLSFVLYFVLKSIPDYLLLRNVSARYGQTHLLRWFLPSQLAYPFYVLAAAVPALFRKKLKG